LHVGSDLKVDSALVAGNYSWNTDQDTTGLSGYTMRMSSNGELELAESSKQYDLKNTDNLLLQRLIPDSTGSGFGLNDHGSDAVDIQGDLLVIGARGENVSKGVVYVYRKTTKRIIDSTQLDKSFQLIQKIPYPGTSNTAYFGEEVSINNDSLILISAPIENIGDSTNVGAVYVYRDSAGTFVQKQRIEPSSYLSGDRFGDVVAFQDSIIAVTSNFAAWNGTSPSKVTIFKERSGSFVETQVFTSPDNNSNFGIDLAIQDSLLLIGNKDWFLNRGAVFTYVDSSGTYNSQDTLLTSSINNSYLISMDFDGKTLAAGTYWTYNREGSVEVWKRKDDGISFMKYDTIRNPFGAYNDIMSHNVEVEGPVIAVGAFLDDVSGLTDVGQAFVFADNGQDYELVYNLALPFGDTTYNMVVGGYSDNTLITSGFYSNNVYAAQISNLSDRKLIYSNLPEGELITTKNGILATLLY